MLDLRPEEYLAIMREYDVSCGYKQKRDQLLTYPPNIPPFRWDVDSPVNFKRDLQSST